MNRGAAVLAVAFAAAGAAAQTAPPIVAKVADALRAVDAARLDATVRTLVGFGTRHVLSRTDSDTEGTGAARRWLQAQYEAIAADSGGRLSVAMLAANAPCARAGMPREVPIVDVVATLRGASDPDRVYVVGGHYDSRNGRGNDGAGGAPGADDDASGTAVALEACRVLSRQTFAATLVFVAYDGEEQGLLGSKVHADALAAAEVAVDGMIGCDIVGNTLGMDGVRYADHVRCFSFAATGNDSSGRSLARAATFAAGRHVPDFAVRLILRGDRFGRGGDHESFFANGFPAIRFSEPREDFSRQHQDVGERDGRPYGDLPDHVDPAYMANVARVVVATLAELASAPPPPRVVRAELRRDRYDTELTYELPAAVERCEFVWRWTTDADWRGVIDMAAALPERRGSAWLATLPGVCLDDAVVGVRCIGADGSRSRVATPPEPDRVRPRGADRSTSNENGR